MELYREVNGKNKKITKDQVFEAEGKMLCGELSDWSYYNYSVEKNVHLYSFWKEFNRSNFNSKKTLVNAAGDAAEDICWYYEGPKDTKNQAEKRHNLARKIYDDMMK